jgi:hypothetical protein
MGAPPSFRVLVGQLDCPLAPTVEVPQLEQHPDAVPTMWSLPAVARMRSTIRTMYSSE